MEFIINNKSVKNIEIGMHIKCVPGYLPQEFNDKFIEVKDIQGYPMVQLEPEQLSGVSPEIISEVQ